MPKRAAPAYLWKGANLMAKTSSGKVVYVPHPNPHPQAGDAPRTGVPTNPLPPKLGGKSAKEVMRETD